MSTVACKVWREAGGQDVRCRQEEGAVHNPKPGPPFLAGATPGGDGIKMHCSTSSQDSKTTLPVAVSPA